MKVDSYNLTAGQSHPFYVPGRFFMLVRTSAPITVRFIKNKTRSLEVGTDVETGYVSKPGDWRDPTDFFEGFELFSATNQTVRIGVSDREGDYRSFVQSVDVAQPDDIESSADVTVTSAAEVELVASNSNRRAVYLYNTGAAQIRVRESLGAATVQGAPIPAGMERKLTTRGAVYAVSEGANCDVAILEEIDT